MSKRQTNHGGVVVKEASAESCPSPCDDGRLVLRVPFLAAAPNERSRPYHLDLQLKTIEAEALDGVFRAMNAEHEYIPGTDRHVDRKADVVRHLIAQIMQQTVASDTSHTNNP